MSQWGSMKEKDGSKSTILVDMPPFVFIIIVFIAAYTIPHLLSKPDINAKNDVTIPAISALPFIVSFVLMGIGLVLFVVSKISVFKKGLLLSFGYKSMKPLYRALYIIGYILMAISSIGLVFMIIAH
jgi:hypothetical protein